MGITRVKVPTEAINDIHNPSFEGAAGFTLTNCTGGGRVTTEAHGGNRGRYSCQVTPTSGTGYVTLTTRTQTNEAHVLMAWIKGQPTKLTNGATDATPTLVELGANGWNRWVATFTAAQSNGQTSCAVKATTTIYVDNVILYAGSTADGYLVYFDGDSGPGRRWLGPRYGSASKQLAVWQDEPVWDGGVIRDLDDRVNVVCSLVVGMGWYPVEAVKDETARGAVIWREQLARPRAAKLVYRFVTESMKQLTELRADWLNRTPVDRPFALLFDIGNTTVEGRFTYVGGMEGNLKGVTESVSLDLEGQDPRLYELANTSVALTVSAPPSASYVVAKEEGEWRGFSGGPGVRGAAAVVYVAPDFTVYWGTVNVGGTAYVQKWDGEAVSDVCSVTGSITAGPQINTLAVSTDGATLYVGGDYTHMNATSGFNGVGKVTLASGTAAKVPSAGTGCSGGAVLCGVIDPSGTYWVVGGTFTSINGVSLSRFGRMTLSGETWSAVTSAAFGAAVRAIEAGTNGDYFVGGNFDASTGFAAPSAPSGSSANYFDGALTPGAVYQFKYTVLTPVGETDPSAVRSVTVTSGGPTHNAVDLSWSAAGGSATGYRFYCTEANGSVFYFLTELGLVTSLAVKNLSTLDKSRMPPSYNTSGHRTPRVAWYDASASAWKNLGLTGMAGGNVYDLELFPDQTTVVAVGDMTTCDGTACGGVAYLLAPEGGWLPLGSGMAGGIVYAVERLPDGRLVAGGAFTSADGSTLAAKIARFDSFPVGVWQHMDIVLAGTVNSLATRSPDELAVGHSSTVTSAAAAQDVVNPGTADWTPQVVIDGPGVLRSLAVYETGDELLGTRTLAPGEQMVIDLDKRTAVSNFVGDVIGTFRPGSNWERFRLPRGTSKLTCHLTGGGSVRLTGQPANVSVDKAAT